MPTQALVAHFQLLAWSYCDGPRLELPELPMLLRRRAGPVDRLALRAALDCLALWPQAPTASIFASRHGEVQRSVEILDALKRGESPSAMAFSLSVHNAAAGLLSLARADKTPATALSAGPDSLAMALFEAAAWLKSNAGPVLVVAYDEALPTALKPFADDEDLPYGLGLLLGAEGGKPCALSLTDGSDNSSQVAQAKRLGLALRQGQLKADLSCGLRQWRWEQGA